MIESDLPKPFKDLEKYLDWSLPTERERSAKRQASDIGVLTEFYEAMLPRMDDVLGFLSEHPLDNIPDDVERLLNLTFSLAEIAPAIENFDQANVVNGYDVARFNAAHE